MMAADALAARLLRPGPRAAALATRLALTGTEVDRVHTHGVTALEHFRRRQGAVAPSAIPTPTA